MVRRWINIDGNEAAAYIAHKTNEVIAIYPITPSSPAGELADQWTTMGIRNLWGSVPTVKEMQSEGGAAGALHGALQAGALSTTFTASQGLLLMIPNMYKIAGELTSTVFHVTARSLAVQALSIFGDHSDVMAVRSTGFAMLFSNSVQEVMDLALIAQAATLESRVPFVHTFDGFRTSHEVTKIEQLTDDDIRALIDDDLVRAHRARALSPDRPVIRGTTQNPDTYFQARETVNSFYLATPAIVDGAMEKFAVQVGRRYHLFDYVGAPDAERVLVMMGSGCEAAEETVDYLTGHGEKVGLIKVRLYRPFSVEHFLNALPSAAKSIAVLDRTKEPGATGEPLYQDVVTAVMESVAAGGGRLKKVPAIIGGRYGLSSKELTPAMIKGVFDELAAKRPKNHFTVGINDDVTHTSIEYDPRFDIEPDDVTRAVIWGLGSDGTVGANRNSIKIIGDTTDFYTQGYFVYDSKKAGAQTISHLRFGPRPIKSTYLIQQASFLAVHQFGFLTRYDILKTAKPGGVFLLNSPYHPGEVWDRIPKVIQQQIIGNNLKFYVIDAYEVARETGLGVRINTIMQTCFFALSGVLPKHAAIAKIKQAIEKSYGKRGETVVDMNFAAVDAALAHLHEVDVPGEATSTIDIPPPVPSEAPEFVRDVLGEMIAGRGDELPVSAFPVDGTYPTATTRWERRNITQDVPVWEPDLCIQCGKCVVVCPHSVLRSKVCDDGDLARAPETFKTATAKWKEFAGRKFTLQLAIDDCTGCTLCVEVCPSKDKSRVGRKAINMAPELPLRKTERENWTFFKTLPQIVRGVGHDDLKFRKTKDIQLLEPLFEFSSACAGCGETSYLRLMSQLFGDRALIANATGCSSIYGGNQPTTPWTVNDAGRGPTWSNSLFEDNAEFGYGMRLAIDKQNEYAAELVDRLRDVVGSDLADAVLTADQSTEAGIHEQRRRVVELKTKLSGRDDTETRDLKAVADQLVKKSVWIVGGDGWAYDIGYGGVDHVIASRRNVNLLVLDTEVYSNTGGQSSKSTPLGAVAKFAAGGKAIPKKDLGLLAMAYGHVYVAQIALGASEDQTIKALLEAEAYDGPSVIIAYSQCIAHGIDMTKGMDQQKSAVQSGHWPLYRYNPARKLQNRNPLEIDSKPPKTPLRDYRYQENRYRILFKARPDLARDLIERAEDAAREHWARLQHTAKAWEPRESTGSGEGAKADTVGGDQKRAQATKEE
ncbi:MAG: pyruvate:ferredoxin (flavodoxin) oxidoreductase [Candidatus Latescibacterota bacterium]|nr:MAG: pyruvate:ferredoxin (flavodoxin) oxidoreductase [Candidatus Latescibacterota bacterium]